MGKGKGGGGHGGGKGKGGWKGNGRDGRQQHKYGDAGWEAQYRQLGDQLRALQLRIKSIAGDGTAVSDQMYGHPNNHASVRAAVCRYIEEHRSDYEPFVEDDVPFERYMRNMKQDKTWGGNIELQAMSLLFKINIAIHQLNSPRWEIVNFAGDRTIHLSYHDGDHYASVRPVGEPDDGVPSVQIEAARVKVVGQDDGAPPAVSSGAPAKKKSKKELRLENKAKKTQWAQQKRATTTTTTSTSSSSSSSSSSAKSSSSSLSSTSSSSSPAPSLIDVKPSAQGSSSSSSSSSSVPAHSSSSRSSSSAANGDSSGDLNITEGETMVMAATDCSLDVARATLRDLCGDVIQAVELLLLLAPQERDKVTLPDATAFVSTKESESHAGSEKGKDAGEEEELDYGAYDDYSVSSWYSKGHGDAAAEEEEEESHDWRDYVTPSNHHQRGGGGGGGRRRGDPEDELNSKRAAEAAQQQQKQRKKSDEPTPEDRLRVLREKRTLTNKERKEKNKLEKDVGHLLDKKEAASTDEPDAEPERPPDLGTLAI